MGGVNGQFKKRVWVAWALFWNELPFPVESLDLKLLVKGSHVWVIKGLK